MSKSIEINKYSAKKVVKILLFVILVPISFIILVSLWFMITNPIFDQLDHDKFTSLDTSMQGLYLKLKSASNIADEWKYENVCVNDNSGYIAAPDYRCITSISLQKKVTSTKEINNLQSKYYQIIDSSKTLKQKTEIDSESFGKYFTVSQAEKGYVEVKTGIDCRYIIELGQSIEAMSLSSNSPGSNISGGTGNLVFSLKCDEKARGSWYKEIHDNGMLIPE